MNITILIIMFWLHVVGDFILQTDEMALNKSTSIKWLTVHSIVYSSVYYFFGWQFMFVNCALHFVIDFVTRRLTSKLWKKGDRHNFFVVIGVDQAIHMTCLVLTYNLL